MERIENWDNIEASKDFENLPIGGYVFKIVKVEADNNASGKPYLKIMCDVAEGKYKNFANGNEKSLRRMRAYYQGNAGGLFKRFVEAVENCNSGYKWNWQEQTLVGKVFGAVLIGREYLDDNKVKLATEISYVTTTTVDKIRKGDFKVPDIEKLPADQIPVENAPVYNEVADDGLPF